MICLNLILCFIIINQFKYERTIERTSECLSQTKTLFISIIIAGKYKMAHRDKIESKQWPISKIDCLL